MMQSPQNVNDEDFLSRLEQDPTKMLQTFTHQQTTFIYDTTGDEDPPTVPQNELVYRAVVQRNFATSSARQNNRAMGRGTMVSENEAHGEGTNQGNTASTCAIL